MKNIKWEKGLLRIWIVGSIVWIIMFLWAGFDADIMVHGYFWIWTFLTPIAILFGFIFIQKILKWIYAGFK
jgi:hypothetical protein